jgi:hypothetical protein
LLMPMHQVKLGASPAGHVPAADAAAAAAGEKPAAAAGPS